MEFIRDNDGFIEIDKLLNIRWEKVNNRITKYYIGDKLYYYKKIKSVSNIYNELVAKEIANRLGIRCASYDLAVIDGFIGVISEDFNNNDTFIFMETILKKCYRDYTSKYNNLEDIWNALYLQLRHFKYVEYLMDELINIFLFDMIIANYDRHDKNYGIKFDNSGFHMFIFDNEQLLDSDVIISQNYCLAQTRDDYHKDFNFIEKFLMTSDSSYIDRLNEMVHVLDDIDDIFNSIELKIGAKMDEHIKNKLKDFFKLNKTHIINTINKIKVKKKLI